MHDRREMVVLVVVFHSGVCFFADVTLIMSSLGKLSSNFSEKNEKWYYYTAEINAAR